MVDNERCEKRDGARSWDAPHAPPPTSGNGAKNVVNFLFIIVE